MGTSHPQTHPRVILCLQSPPGRFPDSLLNLLVADVVDHWLAPLGIGDDHAEQARPSPSSSQTRRTVGRSVPQTHHAKQVRPRPDLRRGRSAHCRRTPQVVADLLRRLPMDPRDPDFEYLADLVKPSVQPTSATPDSPQCWDTGPKRPPCSCCHSSSQPPHMPAPASSSSRTATPDPLGASPDSSDNTHRSHGHITIDSDRGVTVQPQGTRPRPVPPGLEGLTSGSHPRARRWFRSR